MKLSYYCFNSAADRVEIVKGLLVKGFWGVLWCGCS